MNLDFMKSRPTLAQQQATPRAEQKGTPPVIERQEKRQSKKKAEDANRATVWDRDRGICRATGVKLSRSGNDPNRVGEVDHTILRSDDKTRILDPTNCVLISKFLNRLRKVRCKFAGEYLMFDHEPVTPGDQDCGNARQFIWRNERGEIIKTTASDKDGRILVAK